ncbi:MAG: hypothetical protein WC238_02295 [Parcubacteria group bacterium]|jgi:hypothetical protein
MQQKKIIIFLVTIFILGSTYLAFVSDQGRSPDQNKNWWIIYFAEPKGDSLNFAIENHSDKQDFRWEILSDREKKIEGSGKIEKGETRKIEINLTDIEDKKITVDVFNGDEKKEIYKNF